METCWNGNGNTEQQLPPVEAMNRLVSPMIENSSTPSLFAPM
jgi:hypothetical protein